MIDGDRAVRIGRAQNPVLVVMEIGVGDRQVAGLIADACAVVVWHRGA